MTEPKNLIEISIVIVNFNGEKFIKQLFASLAIQTFKNFEVVFIDNNSADKSVDILKKNVINNKLFRQNCVLIESDRNTGFAEGNDIAVEKTKGKYIFFLNTDTTLEKDTLEKLHRAIGKDPFIAGVTPKVYLSRFLPLKIFDSVGMCMNYNGSPYNKGIGQLDLGQYDNEEELMGLCFAACLVRKNIFLALDGLDETYFAYFEDVDWCFKARKSGYKFISVPDAVVNHLHSGTASAFSQAWKYKQIFQNYLRTVLKDFGKKNVLRIIPLKTKDLFLCLFKSEYDRHLKKAILEVLLNFWTKDIFIYALKRFNSRKNFIPEITDENIFQLSINEPSDFFDPNNYTTKISIKMIDFAVYRKNYYNFDSKLVSEWESLKESIYCASPTNKWKKRFDEFAKKKLNPSLTKRQLDLITDQILR